MPEIIFKLTFSFYFLSFFIIKFKISKGVQNIDKNDIKKNLSLIYVVRMRVSFLSNNILES